MRQSRGAIAHPFLFLFSCIFTAFGLMLISMGTTAGAFVVLAGACALTFSLAGEGL